VHDAGLHEPTVEAVVEAQHGAHASGREDRERDGEGHDDSGQEDVGLAAHGRGIDAAHRELEAEAACSR
jgi:hypothetical protein